jgi:histone H3/H4
MKREMAREEIEKRMDELARKYVETHDHKIIEELYRLSLEFEKLEKQRTVKAAI